MGPLTKTGPDRTESNAMANGNAHKHKLMIIIWKGFLLIIEFIANSNWKSETRTDLIASNLKTHIHSFHTLYAKHLEWWIRKRKTIKISLDEHFPIANTLNRTSKWWLFSCTWDLWSRLPKLSSISIRSGNSFCNGYHSMYVNGALVGNLVIFECSFWAFKLI